jgi:lipopolysaccharide export system protein LptA
VVFEEGVVFAGNVKVVRGKDEAKVLKAGVYTNQTVEL